MSYLTKKSFESVKESGNTSGLAKTLTAYDLVLLGLGGIIGTGIFALTGFVAAKYSGPAVMLSYAIAGVVCIFVALAYTELASLLPTSGSVYTYSYVAFGELFAWLVGGVMILELSVSASAVATAWSGYAVSILEAGGVTIPKIWTAGPLNGGVVNLPAIFIVAFVSFLLYRGTKDSKRVNAILVLIKMSAIAVFVFVAVPHFEITNWDNFMPYGFDDVLLGSSILFFAFTGFGSLATAAEECKNPKRDLTIGIIGSLVLSTVLYIVVGGLATGIVSFELLDNSQPLAHALAVNNSKIGSSIVATGAICGMTTVIMMNIYAQSRIFYVMARDGLVPKCFAKIHPKHDSPYITILIFSGLIAILAGLVPLEVIAKMSSMGALIDYIVIMMVVMLFRVKMPEVLRSFKCPALFIVAPVGLLACVYLLFKQIISKEGELMFTGELLIYWFIIVFTAYVIRTSLIKSKKPVDESL
jgi:APA family basic amino acid/polyamine antiporter